MARYLVFFHPGDPVPDRMKVIDDASGPPTVDDDAASLGVTVGSLWIDTANHRAWVCLDATSGAAVWAELTGDPADHVYRHDQLVAETTWTIDHGLGRYPAITVLDSGGREVECAVEHTDQDQAVLTLAYATSGIATCS